MLSKNNNFKIFACLALSVVMMSGISSCSKDDGDDDPRDAFLGTYSTRAEYVFDGVRSTFDYTLTITASSTNKNDILMDNLSDEKISARATISGNAVTIPQQTFVTLGISGSGTLNGNILTFSTSETSTDFTGTLNVNHTATKQ